MKPTKFVEVLKACESANGTGKKKAIQDALAQLDAPGRTLLYLTMNTYITFGIKKVNTDNIVYAEEDADIGQLTEVLSKLANRELSGDAARSAWEGILGQYTRDTSEYIQRIIDKDPRAGFSADTYNKVWPDYKIPTFEVMLADKCDTIEDFEKRITFPVWAAHKFDGNRSIAIVKQHSNGTVNVEYRSRQGKPTEHLNGLFDNEFAIIRGILGYDFVADGEAFARDFTETMNAKKEGNDEAKANMRFRLFFYMPLSDWIAQQTPITMGDNLKNCQQLMKDVAAVWNDSYGPRKVIFEDGKMVNTYQEMMDYCNHVIDVEKQEGLIVKSLNETYTWSRSYTWCKIKRFFDADLQIIGFYPGKPKSRLVNTLGGVWAAGYLEDGTLVLTGVGSGFSDKDRDEIWNNQDKYMGKMMVCKYQDVTIAKGKSINSLRFCTFEHFRDDKSYDFDDETIARLLTEIK